MHARTPLGRKLRLVAVFFALSIPWVGQPSVAATYKLPQSESGTVGSLQEITAAEGEMLVDIARSHDLGQDELLLANPGKTRWIPVGGQDVLLPTRYVLPQSSRNGVVINLPERRLYWYVKGHAGRDDQVVTFPVSVGRLDWSTPEVSTQVVRRKEHPSWYPPASIRKQAAAKGIELPDVVPPGASNPLGDYALYLDLPGYLIHGTNDPLAIGLRVTHGCIRLYPEDVEFLYHYLPDSTEVKMVDQSVKVGWQGNTLFIEVHPPLEESQMSEDEQLVLAMALVRDALVDHPDLRLQSWLVRRAVERRDGIPVSVTSSTVDRQW